MDSILYSKQFGDTGTPVAVLHGLFGSHSNWNRIAQSLSGDYQVYTLDLRNHGNSFHADSHTLDDMAEDFYRWWQHQKLPPVHLIGHSMGGLVAATVAGKFREALKSLTVVDIAPKSYPPGHTNELNALSMPLAGFTRRDEVDAAMAKIIPNAGVRQFLMTNLVRNDDGGFKFRVNVKALAARETNMLNANLKTPEPAVDSLWVYGDASDYVQPGDIESIQAQFPGARTKGIAGAGHWLHYSHTEAFLEVLMGFLKEVE